MTTETDARDLQEGAAHEVLKKVLTEAMGPLDSLDAARAAQTVAEYQELLKVIVQHTPDMEVETMAQSMAEVLIERGMAQGIEQGMVQGKAEGIAEGETRAKQMNILKLLQFRFDTIPQALTDQITSIQSLALLDMLFEQVLAAQTLEDIHWQNHKEG